MEEKDRIKICLICCVGLDFDLDYLPHFAKHYGSLDIDEFKFILQSGVPIEKEKVLEQIRPLLGTIYLKSSFTFWEGVFHFIPKTKKFNEIISTSGERIYILTDIDEFQVWENSMYSTFHQNIGKVVWGRIRDRESPDKTFIKIDKDIDIDKQFPLYTNRSGWPDDLAYKPVAFSNIHIIGSPHDLSTVNKFNDIDSGATIIPVDHYRWSDSRIPKMKLRKKTYGGRRNSPHIWDSKKILDAFINDNSKKTIL